MHSNNQREDRQLASAAIALKPGEQRSTVLGDFPLTDPPKGFSVEILPEPSPAGSVETQIKTVAHLKRCKYILFIANYGTHAVTAKVRQL